MLARMPRWLLITLIALAVLLIVTALVFMIVFGNTVVQWIGIGITIILVVLLTAIGIILGPQLYKAYKFQKVFKAHEAQMRLLPGLMQAGRTQEALMHFDNLMKQAPDNAYLFFMHAQFLRAGGKLPEAMTATKKALAMAERDPMLQMTLQQVGGQMGQPTSVKEFKEQALEMQRSLEPRVTQMRERHEKAVSKRKKKSR